MRTNHLKSQSAMEFIILASFMLLAILGFFAVTSSRMLEARHEGNRKTAEDIASFALREIELARSMNDGYSRVFALPKAVNGVNYSISLIDNHELTVQYLGHEYVKFLPSNVIGNLTKGYNLITKQDGIIYLNATSGYEYGQQGSLDLSCSVTTACGATTVFKISAQSNAHAETADSNNYLYRICCQKQGEDLGTSCQSGYNALKLSHITNAHAEKNTFTDYPVNICVSSSKTNVTCVYSAEDCVSLGYSACLATMSNDTNAHVADCVTDPYPLKVCCR